MADMTEGERIAEERIAEAARTGQDWLDLGDLGLTKLPDALSKLTKLKRLSLGSVSKVDAEGLSYRKATTQRNSLSDISAISSLSEMRDLYLEKTNCNDLSPIAGLQKLQILDCGETQVSDLAPIAGLRQLQHLYCSATKVNDLSPIAGLPRLQNLYCSSNKVSDLSPVAGLRQLQALACSSTQVRDLSPIAGLQQLQRLDCGFTPVSDLSPIAGLQQLQRLNCTFTQISDLSPIARLQQLQQLDCSYTLVSDLSPITGLRQLQELDCENTQVGDLSPVVELTNVTSIAAKSCSVAFVSPAIKNLRKLQSLDLRNNQIKRLPRELGELENLEAASMFSLGEKGPFGLMLEGNPLEDPLPELIAQGQPQATINVLRWLRGEPIEIGAEEPDPPTPVEGADDPPAIPEQGAGPRVVLEQNGRLVFAKPSDPDAKGNDRNRLEALYPALQEAAADLAKALQDHPSNLRNERLLQKAEAYRALVDLPLDEVNFARLYGAGMQLLNAAGATRRALEAGRADVPDLTPLQDECLASIENLHPPFVLASRDGQEMLADQTTIKLTAEAVEGIKEAGTELGQELINHPDLADREVGETIRDAAAEIGQGDNEARDAVNTVSTMRNVTIVLSAGAVAVAIPSVAGAMLGPEGVVAGGIPAWFITKVTEKTKAFESLRDAVSEKLDGLTYAKLLLLLKRFRNYRSLLLKLEPHLRKVTHLPAFKWLDPIIDRLKRKSPPDKKE
ncbi:MAG: leucine-rich repeat domain-containing protein [Alphaproteobacteria bacterium]|nr:leucine-rich repeat domain-containing protein [Alphaproteobacteria bacterium]